MINLKSIDYYTQRNNQINPVSACMNTSRAMFYRGNNIPFNNPSDLQDDDYFMKLLLSSEAYEMRAKKYPHLQKYPPNEIHGMYHSFLDMKVCGRRISDFKTDLTFKDIIDLIKTGQVIMSSGRFPGIDGHAFCFIGCFDDSLVIADPWGDFHTEYKGHGGYGITMTEHEFNTHVKPGKLKWGHVLL